VYYIFKQYIRKVVDVHWKKLVTAFTSKTMYLNFIYYYYYYY